MSRASPSLRGYVLQSAVSCSMVRRALVVFAAILLFVSSTAPLRAEPRLSDAEVLGSPSSFRVESVRTALAGFWQRGHGYQSRWGPAGSGPGSETLSVFQPQIEVVARQGERITHTFWVPVDVVTSASASAIDRGGRPDTISQASQRNIAGAFDWTAAYRADRTTDYSLRTGFHAEEPFRSWNVGMGANFSLADDNTVVSLSANEVYDWFDRFDLGGGRHGRVSRTTTNANVVITQLLSPTTIVKGALAFTIQQGDLGNTWNIVPQDDGTVGLEILPRWRVRPAVVGTVVQWLPWNGALRLNYRYYWDDWGIASHTLETRLHQRLSPWFYVTGSYRVHDQRGADFFTTRSVSGSGELRTADSDLETLLSHGVGFQAHVHYPPGWLRDLELALGYERYFRSNDLDVSVYLWTIGFRF